MHQKFHVENQSPLLFAQVGVIIPFQNVCAWWIHLSGNMHAHTNRPKGEKTASYHQVSLGSGILLDDLENLPAMPPMPAAGWWWGKVAKHLQEVIILEKFFVFLNFLFLLQFKGNYHEYVQRFRFELLVVALDWSPYEKFIPVIVVSITVYKKPREFLPRFFLMNYNMVGKMNIRWKKIIFLWR